MNSLFGSIVSYFVRHGTIANLILATMIVIGLVAITKIRAQFFPDVVLETVTVSADWKGAGPEDIDSSLVAALEPNLLSLDSVESIKSVSRENRALITINFSHGTNMARATEDVKNAVSEAQNLPANIENIAVKRRVWRDRVTNVVISGPVSLDQLSRYADEFSQKLYSRGISRTTISGVTSSIIRVSVPESALVKYDMSLRSVASSIAAESQINPAGQVSSSSTRIRAGSAKKTLEEIKSIVVRSAGDGSKILVGDIAILELEGLSRGTAYFKGEDPAIMIRVDRSARGDAIDIQNLVQETADELQRSLPKNVTVELTATRADAIKNRLEILLKNGAQGLFFVIILLFLFLSARTAFWVAIGIPAAMLFAIAMMYAVGLTMNMISLFALILCLGIVVDDAIVIGEHADFRARRLGEEPSIAAERSVMRMGLPVFTATVTTVLAFGGLVAVGGRFGRLIADIPFTVIVVLLASLVECFLILPNHMRHALSAKIGKTPWYDWPSLKFNEAFKYFREKIFRPIIALSFSVRYPLVAGSLAILAISVSLLISGDVKWRFFSAPERGGLTGNIAMLPGGSRSDTNEMLQELNRATVAVAKYFESEHGQNPVTFVLLQLGGNSGRKLSGSENKDPDLLGSITVELIDADLRDYSSFAFVAELQNEVRRHPLLETLSFRGWRSGPGEDSLYVSLLGADANILKVAAEELKNKLAVLPEISALEDNQSYDNDELVLELTPRGAALGFTTELISAELYHRLNGIEASTFLDKKQTLKIMVGLPKDKIKADFLETTHLRSPAGKYVSLTDIVSVSSRYGFTTVSRENGQRKLVVSAEVSEDLADQMPEINNQLKMVILPQLEAQYGITTELGGLAEQEKSFLNDALIGFSLCLMGIYMALAWVFESWLRPLVIMAIIPFGLIGAMWGHYFWGIPLSMFSIIGLIGMTGIIINDSIVLISTIDEYSKTRGLMPSIIDATCDRLRPVLLTTLTTVLGLLPLLFERSKDAQFLKPTVITLVYGLGFGLLVVILLVPSFVAIQNDLGRFTHAFRRLFFSGRVPKAILFLVWTILLIFTAIYILSFGSVFFTGNTYYVFENILPELSPLLRSFLVVLVTLIVMILFSFIYLRWASKKSH